MLATSAEPVEQNAAARKFALAIGWGLFGATLLMALFLGVRRDIAHAALLPMFWVKLLVPVIAALAGLRMAKRLACPGMQLGRAPALIGFLLLMAWTGTAATLLGASPGERATLIFGNTWKTCPLGHERIGPNSFASRRSQRRAACRGNGRSSLCITLPGNDSSFPWHMVCAGYSYTNGSGLHDRSAASSMVNSAASS